MASLRDAMRTVAQNTSRLLAPEIREKLSNTMRDVEKKYEDMENKLRTALYDNVGLENEVNYLKGKLSEAKEKIDESRREAAELRERLLEAATKATAKKAEKKPSKKKATSKKKTTKKKTTSKKK